MKIIQILETCLYCEDLEAAEKFYTELFGLRVFAKAENRHVFFKCGQSMLLLFNPEETLKVNPDFEVPRHGCSGPGHLCFTMRADEIDLWREELSSRGIAIEQEIEWPSGGYSLYFRDPAGNSLELATRKTWGFEESSPNSDS